MPSDGHGVVQEGLEDHLAPVLGGAVDPQGGDPQEVFVFQAADPGVDAHAPDVPLGQDAHGDAHLVGQLHVLDHIRDQLEVRGEYQLVHRLLEEDLLQVVVGPDHPHALGDLHADGSLAAVEATDDLVPGPFLFSHRADNRLRRVAGADDQHVAEVVALGAVLAQDAVGDGLAGEEQGQVDEEEHAQQDAADALDLEDVQGHEEGQHADGDGLDALPENGASTVWAGRNHKRPGTTGRSTRSP